MRQNRRFFDRIRSAIWPFFWFIAGSSEELIRKSSTHEQDKHFGYGIMILITAMAATLSGFFAFSLIIRDSLGNVRTITALLVAIFWGFIIFNLDRMMVVSMRKYPKNNKIRELGPVIPRIFLALIIALVISKPIEITLLKDQIVKYQELNRRQELHDAFVSDESLLNKRKSENIENRSELDGLNNQKTGLQNGSDQRLTRFDEQHQQCVEQDARDWEEVRQNRISISNLTEDEKYFYEEAENYIPEGDSIPQIKIVKKLNSEGQRERNRLRSRMDELRNRIRQRDCAQILAEKEAFKTNELGKTDEIIKRKYLEFNRNDSLITAQDMDILAAKVDAEDAMIRAENNFFGFLDDLGELRKKERNVWWTSSLLMALFFILETAPIFTKWITRRGAYDDLLDDEELRIQDEIAIRAAERQNDREYKIQNGNVNLQHALESEASANQQLMEDIIKAQSAVAKRMINEWKNREFNRMEANIDQYLDSHINNES